MINEMENSLALSGRLTVPLYERSFGAEAVGDLILSDYQSEIRRILHVCSTVLPPAKYVGDGSVEFNGTVDHQVLYVGGDGGIYSVPFSTDYSFSVPLETGKDTNAANDVQVLCGVTCDGVNTRVSSPRRLSIRCRLRPNVRVYERVSADVRQTEDGDPESVHRRVGRCDSLLCESGTSDVIAVGCAIPLEHDDVRVIRADATVSTDAQRQSIREGCVSSVGEVTFTLKCVREETGEYFTLEGSSELEGEVDIESLSDNCTVRVRGILSEMSVEVREGSIDCSAGIILEAVSYQNESVEYTDDIYSTRAECQCDVRSVSVRKLLECIDRSFTLSERIPIQDTSVPEGARILDSVCEAYIDRCAWADGKYVFGGSANVSVIYENDGEIWETDVSVPIRYEREGDRADVTCFDASVTAHGLAVRIADGSLCIDAEMSISADVVGEENITCVHRVELGDAVSRQGSELIVCYPTPCDDVWSVAKRYRVSPTAVRGDPRTDKYVLIE